MIDTTYVFYSSLRTLTFFPNRSQYERAYEMNERDIFCWRGHFEVKLNPVCWKGTWGPVSQEVVA